MNTSTQYKKYKRECEKRDIAPIGKKQFNAIAWTLEDINKTEQMQVAKMHDMCQESLSPELYEKWCEVKDALYMVRKQLKQ